MILNTGATAVEISSNAQAHSFSIAINPKAFKVLSSTLYQNKQGSIVRELCTNALDSHIMANKSDVAFEVHVPDTFEPWFGVKDFGVGLSEDDVKTIFTVFFQSTKDQTNAVTGSFGLGSKTPFSYTDQFTVESIHQGTKTLYSAFISETGLPSIIAMHSEVVDGSSVSNGVEIKVPVKTEDFWKFKQEIQTQLKFFKVKPIICNSSIEFSKEDFHYQDSDVEVTTHSSYNNVWAIQGSVGYPLNWYILQNRLTSENSNFFNEVLMKYKTYLYFNIGELGVTASRESIEYDEPTVKNINEKLNKIRISFDLFSKECFKNCDNNWDKAVAYNTNDLLRLLCPNLELQGFILQHGKLQCSTYQQFQGMSAKAQHKTRKHLCNQNLIEVKKDTVWLVKDTSEKEVQRLKQFRADNQNKSVVYLTYQAKDSIYTKQYIIEKLGNCKQITWLSDVQVEIAPKVKRIHATERVKTSYYEITDKRASVARQRKSEAVLTDLKGKVVYILTKGNDFVDTESNVLASAERLLTSIPAAKEIAGDYGLGFEHFIGVNIKDYKSIKGDKRFVSAEEYEIQLKELVLKDKRLKVAYNRSIVWYGLDRAYKSFVNSLVIADKSTKIYKLQSIVNTYSEYVLDDKYRKAVSFLTKAKFSIQENNSNYIIRQLNKKIENNAVIKIGHLAGIYNSYTAVGGMENLVKAIEENFKK